MTIYAIGDIHGQLDRLRRAEALIAADPGKGPTVYLGDYVDRGPDSRGVVQHLMGLGDTAILLRGNHDRMFCRYVRDGNEHDARIKSGMGWLTPPLGGQATLQSYGVDPAHPDALDWARHAVPEAHLAFLSGLPLWHQTEDLLFVHAGILPGVPMPMQAEDDLIWIRDGFLDDPRDHGRLIVHGHTALDHPQHFGNRVDLDGGAGYGRPLVPVVFEGRDAFALTDAGRVPLLP